MLLLMWDISLYIPIIFAFSISKLYRSVQTYLGASFIQVYTFYLYKILHFVSFAFYFKFYLFLFCLHWSYFVCLNIYFSAILGCIALDTSLKDNIMNFDSWYNLRILITQWRCLIHFYFSGKLIFFSTVFFYGYRGFFMLSCCIFCFLPFAAKTMSCFFPLC